VDCSAICEDAKLTTVAVKLAAGTRFMRGASRITGMSMDCCKCESALKSIATVAAKVALSNSGILATLKDQVKISDIL